MHEAMSWFGNPQKQITREGSGQVAYLGNDSSERQQGSGEKRQGREGGQSLACEQAGPPRVAGPQSQGELGRGINYASDMPHLRDERGGIFIHQTEYICLSTWLCLVLLVARGIPGCSTWDLVPCLGIEPGPQAMGSWVLATG